MTGHLSEADLEALAHGHYQLVGAAERDHLASCEPCQAALVACKDDSELLHAAFMDMGDVNDATLRQMVEQALTQPPRPIKASHFVICVGLLGAAAGASLWTNGVPIGSASQVTHYLRGLRLLVGATAGLGASIPGGIGTLACLGLATLLGIAMLMKRYAHLHAATIAALLICGLTTQPAHACTLAGEWPDPPPLVTLSLHDVPLSDAIYQIAAALDLGVSLQLDDDPTVGLQVEAQPLPQVLQSLLNGEAYRCSMQAGMLTIRPLNQGTAVNGTSANQQAAGPPVPAVNATPNLGRSRHVGSLTGMGDDVVLRADEWADEVATMGSDAQIDGYVEQDVLTAGGDVNITGHVAGDVVTMGGDVRLSGQIDGDVATMGGDVALARGARLGGEAITLGGKVERAEPPRNARAPWKRWRHAEEHEDSALGHGLSLLVRALAVFLFGLLLNTLWPSRLKTVQQALITRPGTALLSGIGVVLLLPILTIALCVTLIGIPAAALLVAAAFTAVFIAQAAVATVIGAALPLQRIHGRPLRELAAGTAVLLIIWLLPVLGTLVTVATVLLGYGALLQTRFRPSDRALSGQ